MTTVSDTSPVPMLATFVQVAAPSTDLYTPPLVPVYSVEGVFGSTAMDSTPIPTRPGGTAFQVSPPFVDFRRPSPAAAYTVMADVGSTASAAIPSFVIPL